MEKEIKKNKESMKKVKKHIEKAIAGGFKNPARILEYMYLRERILEETHRKLCKMNKKHLMGWRDNSALFN